MHAHQMIRNVTERGFRLAITEHDAIMMYLPLFHLFAFSEGMLMSLVTGARQVLTESFDPAESLELMARERATIVHGFDTHYKELGEAYDRQPRDVSSVRTGIFAAGMASSIEIGRRARKLFGPLVSGYGMSEFGVGAAIGSLDSTEEQSCEASGFPAPGYEIRVVDPTPASISRRTPRARSSSAATRSCAATTTSRRPPPPPSTRTAGCTPATWGCCAPTVTCASWVATRTCSRSAARTSIRWRSRPT
jgi:fatty-acyl-CoA synthase